MKRYRIELRPRDEHAIADETAAAHLRDVGLEAGEVRSSRLFLLEGDLSRQDAEHAAAELLCDPVREKYSVSEPHDRPDATPGGFEIHLRPGVMDPVAESTLAELREMGLSVQQVRTARRYVASGVPADERLRAAVLRALANDCIEEVVAGSAGVPPFPEPMHKPFDLRTIALRDLDDEALQRLSREGHLFLSLDEMVAIRDHFRSLGRDPTDIELETFAQTWSEHCVHKTLKSAVRYIGAGFGRGAHERPDVERRYENLLKDTIVAATGELTTSGRGPECLSVFVDNAGVIGFDDSYGVAFKVETHNHPSAIEPYGGAATGAGGCIRDVLGCGLGARPVANTNVFCVAPGDWPAEELPRGVLHPARVLRGIAAGVADYGNRMGIPTVNGAVHFDPRYLGNPLVYCGCVGLIPRDRLEKAARPGDRIVVIGGRTGRDGIHGATFSSAELTDTHADEFSNAVQIGNAITEKRVADAVLRARDADGGCLYSAITDCGAGGLSSAVGEMGAEVGAEVELERVPLKYEGLRYDEIWISEAQERMVLAVPPGNMEAFLAVCAAEQVEATDIGAFGCVEDGRARLRVNYRGRPTADLDMHFLHEGVPKREREATWRPMVVSPSGVQANGAAADEAADWPERLLASLSRGVTASKEWIIRRYDHEVQGGSVVKPLGGRGAGPNDAAVLRPRLESYRGVALGVGLAPQRGDRDPYWMALGAIDEALRNVVCVGGDPRSVAILDNFCWGRTDDAESLGELVRACQGCRDGALAYAAPFISGKDSLNNEFALDERDAPRVAQRLLAYAEREAPFDVLQAEGLQRAAERVRRTGRLRIPGTLLISAIALVPDVRRCVTADLKQAGQALLHVGGFDPFDFDPAEAARVHQVVADAIAARLVAACHDVSESGWLAALAEMVIGGRLGATIELEAGAVSDAFRDVVAAFVIETRDAERVFDFCRAAGATCRRLGTVTAEPCLNWRAAVLERERLVRAWGG